MLKRGFQTEIFSFKQFPFEQGTREDDDQRYFSDDCGQGRTLPVATGVKLANPLLHVLGVSGDGDAYSIGLGHFIHAARRNVGIEKGMTHRGFSLTDILSPCLTHNKVNTYDWYRKNICLLDRDSEDNPKDKRQAFEKLNRMEKIPVGLIYLEEKPFFEELVLPEKEKPIAFNDLEVCPLELEKIMEKFG